MLARPRKTNSPSHSRRPLRSQHRWTIRPPRHHLGPLSPLSRSLRALRHPTSHLHRRPEPLRFKLLTRPPRPAQRVPARIESHWCSTPRCSFSASQRQNRTPLRHLSETPRHTPGPCQGRLLRTRQRNPSNGNQTPKFHEKLFYWRSPQQPLRTIPTPFSHTSISAPSAP